MQKEFKYVIIYQKNNGGGNVIMINSDDKLEEELPYFKNCVIAFIDLMGIKERICSQYTLRAIWMLIKSIASVCKNNSRLYYKAFSDNIVICEQIDPNEPFIAIDDVLYVVNEIELFMFHIEFPFIRGSVVAGEIFYDDDYVFGDALLKAYRIEQCEANFPRIIVDPSIFDLIGSKRIDYVIADRDGLFFYDFMMAKIDSGNSSLRGIRTLKANIIWNLKVNRNNSTIVSKMEWLVNYFNESCKQHNINCQITMKELNRIGIRCEPLRLIAYKPENK